MGDDAFAVVDDLAELFGVIITGVLQFQEGGFLGEPFHRLLALGYHTLPIVPCPQHLDIGYRGRHALRVGIPRGAEHLNGALGPFGPEIIHPGGRQEGTVGRMEGESQIDERVQPGAEILDKPAVGMFQQSAQVSRFIIGGSILVAEKVRQRLEISRIVPGSRASASV